VSACHKQPDKIESSQKLNQEFAIEEFELPAWQRELPRYGLEINPLTSK
jgi:hypothetical protein